MNEIFILDGNLIERRMYSTYEGAVDAALECIRQLGIEFDERESRVYERSWRSKLLVRNYSAANYAQIRITKVVLDEVPAIRYELSSALGDRGEKMYETLSLPKK